RATALIVRWRKQPAKLRPYAKRGEIAAAGKDACGVMNCTTSGEIKMLRAPGKNTGKDVLLVAKLIPQRIGESGSRCFVALIQPQHLNQLLRSLHRQETEHNGIDQAENGRVRANAQGQSQNGDGGEGRRFAQHAQRKAQILNEGLKQVHAQALAALFFVVLITAELDSRTPLGFRAG